LPRCGATSSYAGRHPPGWLFTLGIQEALLATGIDLGTLTETPSASWGPPGRSGNTGASSRSTRSTRSQGGSQATPPLSTLQHCGPLGDKRLTDPFGADGTAIVARRWAQCGRLPGAVQDDLAPAGRPGVGFAAIKATEGTYYTNPYAAADCPAARNAGLRVYAHSPSPTATAAAPARPQADYLVNFLRSSGVPLLPETEPAIEYQAGHLSFAGG
jgi:hypothetical protein